MTEHSIEELRHQVAHARNIAKAAEGDWYLAQKRLHDAMCRRSGLMGKIASDQKRRILVHDVHFVGDKPFYVKGFKINSDGKVGMQEATVFMDRSVISDLGGEP